MGQQLTGGGAIIGIGGDGGLQVGQKETSCFRWACMHACRLTHICVYSTSRYVPTPTSTTFSLHYVCTVRVYVRTYVRTSYVPSANC